VRAEGPSSLKKRGKGGATPNWEFTDPMWAMLGTDGTYADFVW
jgi:hypothetical protein